MSSALNFTLKHLHSDVEQEKREKLIEEAQQKTEEDEMKGLCERKVSLQNALVLNMFILLFLTQRSQSTPESATRAMSGRASVHPGL